MRSVRRLTSGLFSFLSIIFVLFSFGFFLKTREGERPGAKPLQVDAA
jgi:hypothetical protein